MKPSGRYPSHPLVGVGAVVKRGDEILIVQRGNDPGRGLWSIPGGHVELGESVRDALKREVKEETGLKIEIDYLIDVFDYIIFDEKGKIIYHYVLIDFVAHPIGGREEAASDVLDLRWVKIDELRNYPLTHPFKELLKRYFWKGSSQTYC